MNRCDQARRLFGAYWDDEVTQAEREWLESHLAGCPGCRQQYEQFARTLETVGSLPRTDTAADLPERALVAARRAVAVPDRIAVAPARPMWIQVTATAALLLVGLGVPSQGSRCSRTASRAWPSRGSAWSRPRCRDRRAPRPRSSTRCSTTPTTSSSSSIPSSFTVAARRRRRDCRRAFRVNRR